MRYLLWCIASAAALPLLACLLMRRSAERVAWLIAGAFAVSLTMDLVSWMVAAPGQNNAWVGYIGYPVQFFILLFAVAKDPPGLGIGVGALVLFAMGASGIPIALSAAGLSMRIPMELMFRGLAGFGVGYLALDNVELGWFRGPVLLYAIGCLPFVAGMALLPRPGTTWLGFWIGYQAVRLTALVWMAGLILRGHFARPNVSDFPHARQVNRAAAGG